MVKSNQGEVIRPGQLSININAMKNLSLNGQTFTEIYIPAPIISFFKLIFIVLFIFHSLFFHNNYLSFIYSLHHSFILWSIHSFTYSFFFSFFHFLVHLLVPSFTHSFILFPLFRRIEVYNE